MTLFQRKGLRLALPVVLLLVGAALRFHALAWDTRFHPDEALFATFARKAAVNGDWLLHGTLDKNPLSIYAGAISMMVVGVHPLPNGVLTLDVHAGEFAAQLPGTFASILLMAAFYRAGSTLYAPSGGQHWSPIPIIVMFLCTLSPYALAFSATAFTDGLMLLFVLLAICMAARGQWMWAGIWLGLGFACKQQALFYIPLVVGIGWLTANRGNHFLSIVLRFLLPIAIVFSLLLVWDAARGEASGVWVLAAANNNPGGLIRSELLIPRLSTWAEYMGNMAGMGWLTAALFALAMIALSLRAFRKPLAITTKIDLLLLVFTLLYFGFHWLIAFPVHDRYALLLLPPVLFLMARGLGWAWKRVDSSSIQIQGRGVAAVLILSLLTIGLIFPAIDATEGRIGVGGDQGEHTGIDQLGAYLDAKPLGTIIYDHWLGWELGYYLGTWSNKRLTYYPQPILLAIDAEAQSDPAPRYLVAPIHVSVRPWLDALRAAGFYVVPDYRTARQVAYKVVRKS